MKKISKGTLVLLICSVFLLGSGPTTVLGYQNHSDYENASQKILEEIKSFTFVGASTTLNYSIVFGAMFIKLNSTHSKLVSDIYVITLSSPQYLYPLTVTLDYSASFLYAGISNTPAGVLVESVSMFEFSDVLYNYSIHSVLLTNDLFPLDLDITVNYDLTSSEFSESGIYVVSKNFVMASSGGDDAIPGYFLSIMISILVVGVLSLTIIYKKKKISRKDQ